MIIKKYFDSIQQALPGPTVTVYGEEPTQRNVEAIGQPSAGLPRG